MAAYFKSETTLSYWSAPISPSPDNSKPKEKSVPSSARFLGNLKRYHPTITIIAQSDGPPPPRKNGHYPKDSDQKNRPDKCLPKGDADPNKTLSSSCIKNAGAQIPPAGKNGFGIDVKTAKIIAVRMPIYLAVYTPHGVGQDIPTQQHIG